MQKIILTGITPSGTPHLGNYISIIKPSIEIIKNKKYQFMYFIADQHSLIKLWNKKLRKKYIYEIAASWLALGLDHNKAYFYLQSDIPEIIELSWIISTTTNKTILNNAHAYKNLINNNLQKNITIGLFNYPILMAADIFIFDANLVLIGKDQIQHIEIAKKIAKNFNKIYQKLILKTPKHIIIKNNQNIPGLDGRKMSKSYKNTIPIFLEKEKLKKYIMKIITNSQTAQEKKNPNKCTIFTIYKNIANQSEIKNLKEKYLIGGLTWIEAKKILFEKINEHLKNAKEKYNYYINNHKIIDEILSEGAAKARPLAKNKLKEIKNTIGI